MRVLTPTGYKSIEDLSIGDELIGEDGTINYLERVRIFDRSWFEEMNLLDEWKWFIINDKHIFFRNQNMIVSQGDYNLCHVFELKVGWKILDKDSNEIEITSIKETNESPIWYKLDVSGDHTFITQDVLVHNASRYWVGGGSSANWNATANTNWSATSGGSNNASVPGSTDDAIFNGAGVNGNTNSTISAIITLLSLTTTSGYTATITRNAILTIANTGAFTIDKATGFAGSASTTLLGQVAITANNFSAGDTFWNANMTWSTSGTKTLISASGDIKLSGVLTTGNNQTISSTGVTLTLSGGYTSTGTQTGTAKIILTGGTWSGTGATNNNLDIDGNITVSGTVLYQTNTLKYVSGTVTVTGSTLSLGGASGTTVIDTDGMSWNTISLTGGSASQKVTLASNLTCNALTMATTTQGPLVDGNTLYINTSFTTNTLTTGVLSGTTKIVMNGTNVTLAMPNITTGGVDNDMELAQSGTCTITSAASSGLNGGFRLAPTSGTMVFKITSGTITNNTRLTIVPAASSTVNINCNTSNINLGYVVCRTTNASQGQTFDGTNGLTITTLDLQYTGNNNTTVTFKNGNTYTIQTNLRTDTSGIAATNQTVTYTVRSDSSGNRAAITLPSTASQNLYEVNFTDIDASGAQTIYSYGATVTNCLNIIATPTRPLTIFG